MWKEAYWLNIAWGDGCHVSTVIAGNTGSLTWRSVGDACHSSSSFPFALTTLLKHWRRGSADVWLVFQLIITPHLSLLTFSVFNEYGAPRAKMLKPSALLSLPLYSAFEFFQLSLCTLLPFFSFTFHKTVQFPLLLHWLLIVLCVVQSIQNSKQTRFYLCFLSLK